MVVRRSLFDQIESIDPWRAVGGNHVVRELNSHMDDLGVTDMQEAANDDTHGS
jgi:hypothetical protein